MPSNGSGRRCSINGACRCWARLGRRRSWLVLSQLLVILGLIGMGFCDPQKHLSWLIAIAVVVAFASATQDIAIDAYRLEIAERQPARPPWPPATWLATASPPCWPPLAHCSSPKASARPALQLQTFGLGRHVCAVRPADGARAAHHPVSCANRQCHSAPSCQAVPLQLCPPTGLGVRADHSAGLGAGDVHSAVQHRFRQRAVSGVSHAGSLLLEDRAFLRAILYTLAHRGCACRPWAAAAWRRC